MKMDVGEQDDQKPPPIFRKQGRPLPLAAGLAQVPCLIQAHTSCFLRPALRPCTPHCPPADRPAGVALIPLIKVVKCNVLPEREEQPKGWPLHEMIENT